MPRRFAVFETNYIGQSGDFFYFIIVERPSVQNQIYFITGKWEKELPTNVTLSNVNVTFEQSISNYHLNGDYHLNGVNYKFRSMFISSIDEDFDRYVNKYYDDDNMLQGNYDALIDNNIYDEIMSDLDRSD